MVGQKLMANEAHLSLLKQGAAAWNDMLRQRMDRADLSEADLTGVDLRRGDSV
jgi:uncharacterized Zn ribbon protein